MSKIMIVEDDASIISFLEDFLLSEGYESLHADKEGIAIRMLEKESCDLALIDIGLLSGNGFRVCEAAKKLGIPVIFLTAKDDENSVVRGLDMGADDYVAKPFRPRELLSRIKSVLRRYDKSESKLIVLGNVTVDTDKAVVCKDGKEITLSALEYRLLMVFISNRGILLSRNKLLEDIWDIAGDYVNDNTLTVYIKRLRDKVEDDPTNPTIILTVRGMGYKLGE